MTNRLANEVSPYLRQHADNPVDWYPWGPEARARARSDDRPILLSIGYSACHWCHVMEKESFENESIARQMNESFVCVKVDREERPDIDQVYQLAVQALGGRGGWPLTVVLTPDEKPFLGGTYFPPSDRYGIPGFPRVLEAASEAYRQRRSQVVSHAVALTDALTRAVSGGATSGAAPSPDFAKAAADGLADHFDEVHGGFGTSPKFPNTMSLEVLLRVGDEARVRLALNAMASGGMFDHLGGGFHRYSTDERWLVPHFEKMLYDNALLLHLYTDASRALRDTRYTVTARAIAGYVLRDMVSPEGGFYSAEDADSEGEEGKFYTWTSELIDEALGADAEAAAAAKRVFGVGEEGPAVLSLAALPRDGRERAALERASRELLLARDKRPRPLRDEKVLASWSCLMIGALADAASVVGPELLVAAERAMGFVETRLVVPEGQGAARVMRHCKDGTVKGPGFLDDHALAAYAALELYYATGEPHWVSLARAVAESILGHFADSEAQDFFFAADDSDALIVRAKESFDHAVPSATSVACRALLDLGTLVDPRYALAAEPIIRNGAAAAADHPLGMSSMVCLVDRWMRGSVDVVLVGRRGDPRTRSLAGRVMTTYLPDRVVAWIDPSDPSSVAACPALAEGKAASSDPVAYVCRGRSCSPPAHGPDELSAILEDSQNRSARSR